ncbi:hypothetical protein [Limnoglobus roseus]|uniref:hypothetical protein n=1 Tax=Limnoglobus roseus TaxID=2598579 RepID=UPI0011EB942D|nr:hypothetical protein [Limnoglobus roseus]
MAEGPRPESRRTPGRSSDARPAGGFVPVRVVSDAAAEVVRPGGVVLRVPVTADPAHVGRLVAAIRGATC